MQNINLEQLELNDDWQHAYQKINRNLIKLYSTLTNDSKNGMNLNSSAIVNIVQDDIDYDIIADKVKATIIADVKNIEHPVGSFVLLANDKHPKNDLKYPGEWKKIESHTVLSQVGTDEIVGSEIGSNEVMLTQEQLPICMIEYAEQGEGPVGVTENTNQQPIDITPKSLLINIWKRIS